MQINPLSQSHLDSFERANKFAHDEQVAKDVTQHIRTLKIANSQIDINNKLAIRMWKIFRKSAQIIYEAEIFWNIEFGLSNLF
jgi:hypothetical protein